MRHLSVLFFAALAVGQQPPQEPKQRDLTLDTTRADAMRPDVAPQFNQIAKRGLRFTQAYTPVPQTLAARAGAARWAALARLATDRRFWLFTASAAALQSSHQLYYGFGTLYWRELGFSDTVIGVLWAEGVVAEIVLFWPSAPLLARLGP